MIKYHIRSGQFQYFKTLNIIPKTLCDEEIINTNVDEKWLYETYFETYSHCHIKNTYWALYDDYIRHYRAQLNVV